MVRDTSEALGFLRGLSADGVLSVEKIAVLGAWLLTNEEFAAVWPFNELSSMVTGVLKNKSIRESDLLAVHSLIERITGEQEKRDAFENLPTTLPFSSPEPKVIFSDKEFVLTGKFEFGTRKACEAEIVSRGGRCGDSVTIRSHYLVIGSLSSRGWVTTAWGNKIRKAAERTGKRAIFIISEERWQRGLKDQLPSPGLPPSPAEPRQ